MNGNFTFKNNSEISERFELLTGGVDAFFLATSGSVVLFMHAGFACLEAGSVRAKNTTNILMKNWADLCFGKFWKLNLECFRQSRSLKPEEYLVGCRRVRQLGGLVPVVRRGVPLGSKACKLCDPLSYLLINQCNIVIIIQNLHINKLCQ